MSRSRSFSILGLQETATKEQVKAAYERKAARYKGPDYAEEPAYAERKLSQLYQAYQEAYALAESGSIPCQITHVERGIEKDQNKKPERTRRLLKGDRDSADHNFREKFHQWMEQRDDAKQRRKDRKGASFPKIKKPELKMPNLKRPDFSGLKEKVNELLPENELFQSEKTMNYDIGETLSESGTVTPAKPDSKRDEKIGAIISIIITVVFFAIGSCDSSSEEDYIYEDEPSYAYIYDEDWELITEEDEAITVLADDSYFLLIEDNDNESAVTYDEIQSDYQEEAELFVENYFEKDSVEEVADYLYEEYPSFYVDEEDSMAEKLDAIFAFYGFMELSSAVWYDNPYTGYQIQGYDDYLHYLNQFYEEQ